ncbi:MAG: hypothetical protein ACI4MJ_12325 [Aristaeellaceae bacterium]
MNFDQLVNRLERKLGRFAIRDLMTIIVMGMAAVFAINTFTPLNLSSLLAFNKAAILRGQVWRLVTFIFIPPNSSLLMMVFALYFEWLVGSALSNQWGAFRFNLYYLTGMLGTILAGCITGYATNSYLNLSLFLGFACLYPDFEVNVFFLLPVKVKYLALLSAAGLVYSLIVGTMASRLALVMALLNLLLFFSGDLVTRAKNMYRRYQWKKNFRK